MLDYKTWEQSASVLETIEVSRNTVRDFYMFPNNVKVIENTVLPWNIFKPSFTYVWLDLLFQSSELNIVSILDKFNGIQCTDLYVADGYFNPEFREVEGEASPMERAYNFSNEVSILLKQCNH